MRMGSLGAVGGELTEPVEFAKEGDVILYVNGKCHVLPPDVAHQTLLEYLRGKNAASLHWMLVVLCLVCAVVASTEPMLERAMNQCGVRSILWAN